jgi:hypothetical protein
LDLQLPSQSVPITTDVVSSNLDQGEVYNITCTLHVIKFVSDLRQVEGFLRIMLYTSPWSRFELTTSVVIGTDWLGSCKSKYHTITATTTPLNWSFGRKLITI